MSQVTVSNGTDVRVVPAELAERYAARGFEVSDVASQAEQLRGAALDKALDDAGLPKNGSAAEKRARLAEHRAAQSE
jgi:hypothetical protein